MPRSVASVCIAFVLLALASPARAEVGVSMHWDDCGEAGLPWTCTSCASNAGANVAVASFVPPAGVTELTGLEVKLEIESNSAVLPAWWDLYNAGSCRPSALSVNTIYESRFASCLDPWEGQAVGGVDSYHTYFTADPTPSPNRARVLASFALPPGGERALEAEREYFAFQLRINHSKSVGDDACEGCSTPVRMWMVLHLVQPIGLDQYYLSNALRDYGFFWQAGPFGYPCSVPAQNRTWGRIKAMYR